MTYFSKFPTITYDFTAHTDPAPIQDTGTDISTRISMVLSDQDFANMTLRYTIMAGELPQHVSNKFYGTPNLDWAVLYINGIGNLNNEWPLTDQALTEFIATKYGVTNVNNVHHYEKLPEGVVMDQQYIITTYGQDALNIVTNTDYEIALNEQKRMIYLVKPDYINEFVKRYMALLP